MNELNNQELQILQILNTSYNDEDRLSVEEEMEIYNMLDIKIEKIKLFSILDNIINLREKEIELLKEFKSVNKNT